MLQDRELDAVGRTLGGDLLDRKRGRQILASFIDFQVILPGVGAALYGLKVFPYCRKAAAAIKLVNDGKRLGKKTHGRRLLCVIPSIGDISHHDFSLPRESPLEYLPACCQEGSGVAVNVRNNVGWHVDRNGFRFESLNLLWSCFERQLH